MCSGSVPSLTLGPCEVGADLGQLLAPEGVAMEPRESSWEAGCDGCPNTPQTEAVLPLVPPVNWGPAAHVLGQPEAIVSGQILVLSPRLEAWVLGGWGGAEGGDGLQGEGSAGGRKWYFVYSKFHSKDYVC